MDNKRYGRIDNETKSLTEKRDEYPSIVGTVVSTLPSPSSLSRTSNSEKGREGCDTISNHGSSDQTPTKCRSFLQQEIAKVLETANAQGKQMDKVFEQDKMIYAQHKQISNLTRENKSLEDKVSKQDKKISEQGKKISEQEQEVKEVKEELKRMKDVTCEGEIRKDVEKKNLKAYFDQYPALRKVFAGNNISLVLFAQFRHSQGGVGLESRRNGFTMLQLHFSKRSKASVKIETN